METEMEVELKNESTPRSLPLGLVSSDLA
jgi:hypothetical protein